jgi:hypothetical protein
MEADSVAFGVKEKGNKTKANICRWHDDFAARRFNTGENSIHLMIGIEVNNLILLPFA